MRLQAVVEPALDDFKPLVSLTLQILEPFVKAQVKRAGAFVETRLRFDQPLINSLVDGPFVSVRALVQATFDFAHLICDLTREDKTQIMRNRCDSTHSN